ncbi:MAG: metallopeptidase TldD-related protein [Rickettsiales bacterium]|jgi:PmbA protein|nr:metallopeptidase TldD-related protein [Rickettsiales bacterium]
MNRLNLLQDVISKVLKLGASDADAIIIDSTSLSSEVRLGNLINIDRAENAAIALRVLIDQKQAIVSTSDFSNNSLDNIIERAIAMAKVTPKNPHLFLAERVQMARNIVDLELYDSDEPSAEELIDQAKITESYALENKNITNSEGAAAHYQTGKIYFSTSKGFVNSYQSSSRALSLSVIAGKDQDMQTGNSYSVARFAVDLKSEREVGLEAASNAIDKMNPRKLPTAEMAVIFDRKMAGRILGALSSAINGSSISRGTSFLANHLGKDIFRNNINIIDNPFLKKGLSSRPFDAEAIMGKRLNVVENGVLNSYFLDLQTASKLNLQSTGHAMRGLSSSPSPGSSNLYMQAGQDSLEDMIKSIKKGVLVTEVFGHGANIVTGDYSQGAGGFYIENGKIIHPVSEITIAGNLKDMFRNIIPANDLKFEYSINSPSLLIEKMTVAGA